VSLRSNVKTKLDTVADCRGPQGWQDNLATVLPTMPAHVSGLVSLSFFQFGRGLLLRHN